MRGYKCVQAIVSVRHKMGTTRLPLPAYVLVSIFFIIITGMLIIACVFSALLLR